MTKFVSLVAPLLMLLGARNVAQIPPSPVFSLAFEEAQLDSAPAELLVLGGSFKVAMHDGGRVLELAGTPLDTYGVLFGPAMKEGVSATARFLGTKQGRKFPAFAVSLNGVGGHRLQVSPGKNVIELVRADQTLKTAPFSWSSGEWTTLKLQLAKSAEGKWLVQGKVWAATAAEPEQWSIVHEVLESPGSGKAGIWGTPYAGTPILFDDLRVEAVE
jgi:hypothetical protein